ncbi:MAG: HlyD family secretion protein [Sphingobacteriales bacterium JAD_PAG50586_3]|nr:MAG: HlyD family secretion protein [Sphingobacteriales bacterium JAD_PAG50586_3]
MVLLGGAFFAYNRITYGMAHENTENSQIEANLYPMSFRVGGFVDKIFVADNQQVKKGDTLAILDSRDLAIKVQQAQIALDNAIANVDVVAANAGTSVANANVSNSNIGTAQANVDAADVRVWQATQDFNRIQTLFNGKSATQQQLDNAKAAKETAEKQLIAAQKQLITAKDQYTASGAGSTAAQRQIRLAQITVDQRKSDLDMAKLNLSYAYVLAPTDGFVSRKSIQLGQLVNPGQSICTVVDNSKVWVVANFKETQIEDIKIGQTVTVEVDAYPSQKFEGKVESIQAGTGAKFSLLPPDNSSGNFVKVVQRVPVKIVIDNTQLKEYVLRPGMNCSIAVDTK